MPPLRTAIPWRPAVTTAVVAAAAPVVVSLVLVLVTLGTSVPFIDQVRHAVRAWLVAVGATLTTDGTTFTLVPVGGTLVVASIAALAARRTVQTTLPDLGAFAAMAGGVAGVIGGVLSAATNAGGTETSVIRATFGAFLVVGLGALFGAASRHERIEWWPFEAKHWRHVVPAAVVGLGLALAGGLVVLLGLMTTYVERAGHLWASVDPGVGGGIVLAVLTILSLPTLALWTVSVLVGPGFLLGEASEVTLGGADLAVIPGFPVLAAVPAPGAFGWWVWVVAALPVLAGVVAGWRFVDLVSAESADLAHRLAGGAVAGALGGLVLALLLLVSRGSIGPGLLQSAGPPTWFSGFLAVAVMAVGGALGAAVAHYRGTRALVAA